MNWGEIQNYHEFLPSLSAVWKT